MGGAASPPPPPQKKKERKKKRRSYVRVGERDLPPVGVFSTQTPVWTGLKKAGAEHVKPAKCMTFRWSADTRYDQATRGEVKPSPHPAYRLNKPATSAQHQQPCLSPGDLGVALQSASRSPPCLCASSCPPPPPPPPPPRVPPVMDIAVIAVHL